MTTQKKGKFRVLKDSVTLSILIGFGQGVRDSQTPFTKSVVYEKGSFVEADELVPATVEAYERGDEWETSILEWVPEGDLERSQEDVAAGVEVDPEASGPPTNDGDAVFNPTEHTVEEVIAYLETADDAEVQRVKELEAKGKKRVTIANFEPANAPVDAQAQGGGGEEKEDPDADPAPGSVETNLGNG